MTISVWDFEVHPSCNTFTNTSGFFFLAKKESRVQFEPGPFSVKEIYLMLYSIQSQRRYCFRHRGWWKRRVFRASARYLQCSKRQGSCLLQVSNTHTPYSSDVSHEGISDFGNDNRQAGPLNQRPASPINSEWESRYYIYKVRGWIAAKVLCRRWGGPLFRIIQVMLWLES